MRGAVSPELVQDTTIRGIAINLKSNFHDTPPEAEFMITDRIQVRGASDFENYCYAVARERGGHAGRAGLERLGEISQPTLVLFGENDNLIPNRYLHGGTRARWRQGPASRCPARSW